MVRLSECESIQTPRVTPGTFCPRSTKYSFVNWRWDDEKHHLPILHSKLLVTERIELLKPPWHRQMPRKEQRNPLFVFPRGGLTEYFLLSPGSSLCNILTGCFKKKCTMSSNKLHELFNSLQSTIHCMCSPNMRAMPRCFHLFIYECLEMCAKLFPVLDEKNVRLDLRHGL